MSEWYIQGEEEDEGPLRPKELLKKVREGEVSKETMIRKDDSNWCEAGAVGGLFEAAMRPTIEYFCPQCSREVEEPPTICTYCGREVREGIAKITENAIIDPAQQSLADKTSRSVKNWLQKKKIVKDDDDQ